MSRKVNHYGSQYGHFKTDLYQEIRKEAFGVDIGQNGWLSASEQDSFMDWLNLDSDKMLLDIACGSGGPTLRIAERTGCSVIGIDIHEQGIDTANQQKHSHSLTNMAKFQVSDGGSLPFESNLFDAVICVDSINHLPNRAIVLQEWKRVLKPNGKLLFTDPITVTGMITKEDFEIRASIGYFLFVAEGVDEMLLNETGFRVLKKRDCTENMAQIAKSWKEARDRRSEELIAVEGKDAFKGQQEFFNVCAKLARDRHLTRFAFLSEKIDLQN